MSCVVERISVRDDGRLDRSAIQSELYALSYEYLTQRIVWLDDMPPLTSFQEAVEFVENQYGYRDKYACVAVRFYDADHETLKADKRYMELAAKRDELMQKRDNITGMVYIKTLNAKIVTCKECGGGIPTAQWDSNFCPFCRADLRPAPLQKRLAKMADEISALAEQITKRRSELSRRSGKISWMVRFAYRD